MLNKTFKAALLAGVALFVISPAYAETTTDKLNQDMLNRMQQQDDQDDANEGEGEKQASQQTPCPTNSALASESPECLADIAPASGDEGGESGESEGSEESFDDSLNDEAPPEEEPPAEEEPPQEEEPTDDEDNDYDEKCDHENYENYDYDGPPSE